MGKILGILLLIICGIIVGLIFNFIIDLIVILFKKLTKKIRMAMGIPYKDELPKDEEAPEQVEVPKTNANDLLQKILAKRKNATSDVVHPVDEGDKIEVTDYEIKE